MQEKSKAYAYLNQPFIVVVLLHTVLAILKLFWIENWTLELHYEEAQYWLWSKQLDWSYYSKPPFIAWANALSTHLFGDTVLAVKLPAIIAGFITSMAIYKIAMKAFQDERIALLSSLFLYFMPFYYSVSLFHSTDSFLVAFGAISFYYFQKGLQSHQRIDFILMGLFIGLASITKYSGVLIGVSYCLYVLIWQRSALLNIVIGGFVAILCFTPVISWNIQNDWVTIKHVSSASSGDAKTIVDYVTALFEYIGGQVAIITPFFFFLLFNKRNVKNKQLKLLLFPPVFSFVFFLFVLIRKGSAPNVNWPFFTYSTLAIVFAYLFIKKRKLKWLLPVGALMALLFAFISNTSLLDKVGIGSIIPPNDDPTEIYHLYEDLAQHIETEIALNDYDAILFNNYKLLSPMQFYMGLPPQFYYIGSGDRANQFTFWNEIESLPSYNRNFLFVSSRESFPPQLAQQFSDIELIKTAPSYWRGEPIKTYYLFSVTGAQEPLKNIVYGY